MAPMIAGEGGAEPHPSNSGPQVLGLRVLFFCFMAAFVDGIDTQTLAIAVPLISKDWGVPIAAFAPAFVSFSAGLIIGSVLAGWTSDRLGSKATLLAAVLLVGLSTMLVPLTGSVGLLSAVRFFGGSGVGGALVCIIAICTQLSGGAQGERMAMIVYVGAPLGYLVASLGGASLLDAGQWELLFYVCGSLPLILALILLFALPNIVPPSRRAADKPGSRSSGLFGGAQTARTLMLWLVMLLGFTATFLLINWLPSILTMAGLSAGAAAVSGSVIYVGSIVGTLILAAAAARFPIGIVLSTTFSLGAASAFAIHILGPASGAPALLALTVLGIALVGGQIALMVFSASLYPPLYKGRGVGWAVGIGRIGSLLGPALGAWLIGGAASRDSIFLVLAALICACALAIVTLGWILRGSIGENDEPALV